MAPSCRAKRIAYPIPLEAILGAEIAFFIAILKAGRTLERASVVVAVVAHTFPYGGGL